MPRRESTLGFLQGLLGQVSEQQKSKRDQSLKLEQILMEQQAQQQFDPESQAKAELLKLIGAQPPSRMNLSVTQPDLSPMRGGNPAGMAQSLRGESQSLMQTDAEDKMARLMQLAGVRSYGAGMVPTVVFDPNTGTYETTDTMIPRGAPVRNKPLSNETLEGQSAARASGSTMGSPAKKAVLQNFKDLSAGIDRVDQMLASDAGFKDQLFKTGVPFQPGAGELTDELTNLADILLRARSGAQISEPEYHRLRGLLPRSRDAISEFFGNPDRARKKLVKFRESLDEILSSGTPSQLGENAFSTEEEAEAADLPAGTRITIGGRPAVVQ